MLLRMSGDFIDIKYDVVILMLTEIKQIVFGIKMMSSYLYINFVDRALNR